MSDLKPCPFCGCEKIIPPDDYGLPECDHCGAVAAEWNTRPRELTEEELIGLSLPGRHPTPRPVSLSVSLFPL